MHSLHSCFFLTAGGAKLFNVPQLFDNIDPARCRIVECFSTHSTISAQTGVKVSYLPHVFDNFGRHAEQLF